MPRAKGLVRAVYKNTVVRLNPEPARWLISSPVPHKTKGSGLYSRQIHSCTLVSCNTSHSSIACVHIPQVVLHRSSLTSDHLAKLTIVTIQPIRPYYLNTSSSPHVQRSHRSHTDQQQCIPPSLQSRNPLSKGFQPEDTTKGGVSPFENNLLYRTKRNDSPTGVGRKMNTVEADLW